MSEISSPIDLLESCEITVSALWAVFKIVVVRVCFLFDLARGMSVLYVCHKCTSMEKFDLFYHTDTVSAFKTITRYVESNKY